ncbi:YaiI/YqxD family protein [Lentisphaerota bacterium ZTH]|nr:YaiI/YqxD family protein [Lentisphaerota bacterium]WET07406.1 YaiI/YqxD family protein [Lentisphaerota bacterium ZTH]
MKLYVDGDAFPNILKPVFIRAVERLQIATFVIANKRVTVGPSKFVTSVVVKAGPDEADNRIVEMVEPGDLVITADIPLADRVLEKNARVIDHRGGEFTAANIKNALAMRELLQELRDTGEVSGGPSALNQKDVHAFANQFDRILTRMRKEQ